ncbi:MAG: anti-sigma factor [Chloroflexi bacterium]|nr:anti-sigma factor [Chloroflexota bacterium]MYD49413.1 anti-sigma factor [Chloroflexota bacterium]
MWSEHYNGPGNGPEHPEEALAAFALNALDDAEFQAVFHHVVKCLHCQEVLLGFQEASARLTGSAPEVSLPVGMKSRVLAAAVGREEVTLEPALPPADARWSMKRLRRWLAPAAVGALSVLLAVSVGVMVVQQREIGQLSAAYESVQERPPASTIGATASVRGGTVIPSGGSAVSVSDDASEMDAETVDLVKQEMAEMVEASVMSAQPETEKMPMSSPMGTEPEAKGVLMVEPSGRRGMLMVSGMPADSYQIWLVRDGRQVLVDRIVVNDDDGAGVKELELDESIFHFHQVALTPDERHGPTNPTGEQFLTALIRH